MKAMLCKSYGTAASLVLEDIPEPNPAHDEVLVEVHACGVNFPDTLIIAGQYQFKPEPPFSPGAEVAGVVRGVGADVRHIRVGDRVMASTTYGGFAEMVVANADRVVPVPATMDMVDAAAFLMAFGTSYHGLVDRARLQPGETLLVLGAAGGVGLAAVEIGVALGARVIAVASSAEKLKACRQKGASELIVSDATVLRARLKELTSGRGVDVVYDPVGGQLSEPALRSMAWRGRYLVVGFASGDIPAHPFNLALLKGCSITGVFLGGFLRQEPTKGRQQLEELSAFASLHGLRSNLHAVLPLDQAAAALDQMSQRNVIGKIVLVTQNYGAESSSYAAKRP